MGEPLVSRITAQLRGRALPGGGFQNREGGDFRPDATAWAVVALRALGAEVELQEAARQRLAAWQLADGRVSLSPDHPESFWPTPLAILAWQGSPAYLTAQGRAAAFLLATTGLHWLKKTDSPFGHNTGLSGWPWTDQTHSWVEPTVLAVIGLEVAGYGNHPRLAEARSMLLDRQMPEGGWNYGNTTVFGQLLHPMPETTGLALNALSQKVPRALVQKSLAYLENSITTAKTPRTLSWGLLGLGAWGARPASAEAWLEACLARQEWFGSGGYDTTSLALLLVASSAPGGLVNIFQT